MVDTYKLQLRHGAEAKSFSTRDEVIAYINGQLQYGGVSLLPYEPVLFFYGADDAKSAVILVGLPENAQIDGQNYFLIDTTDIKRIISEMDEKFTNAVSDLQSEDEEIWSAINKEIEDRKSGDTTLQDNINAEATAREDADHLEATAREEKDTELQKNINAEATARKDADEEEKSARQEGDKTLQSNIDAEASTRYEKDNELNSLISFNKDDLQSIIDACGLIYNEKLTEDRVSYTPDTHDEIIRDSEDLADAIDKVSKFATKISKSLIISVDDTETVSLEMTPIDDMDGGNTITANVKLSDGGSISGRTEDDDNILSVQKDGLFATVDLSYDSTTNILTFRKSDKKHSDGVEKTFNLGGHTVYESDNVGHTVKMTVTTEGDEGTISGDVVISSDSHNNLKVKDNALFVDNHSKAIVFDEDDNVTVFTKLNTIDSVIAEDKKALYDEIDRAKAAEKANADAISAETERAKEAEKANADAISAETERAKEAEKANADAIATESTTARAAEKANADAIATESTTARAAEKANADAIAIINGNEATVGSINKALADAKVYANGVSDTAKSESVKYTDEIAKSIEVRKNDASDLQYILYVNKEAKGTIDIPKDQFLKTVDYNNKSKELTLIFETQSDDKRVVINISDLIDTYTAGDGLSEDNGEFSVNLSGDAETKKYLNVDANGVTLNGIDGAIATAVSAEATTARAAEKVNADAISFEVERAKAAEKENADAIADEEGRAERAEHNLEDAIGNEVTRAKAAEGKNATDILAETNRAKEAEKANADAISSEVERAKAAEKENADAIAANAGDIATEFDRAKTAEGKNAADILAETNRAKEAEKENANAITTEVTRATDKETYILEKVNNNSKLIEGNTTSITTETERAKAAEKENADAIKENSNAISTNETNITNEIADRKAADVQVLSDAKVYTNETISTVNGKITEVKTELTKSVETLENADKQTLADAKTYTNDEVVKVKELITANDTAIKTEVINRTNADAELKSKLLVKITANDTAIKTEITNRINAVNTLSSELKGLITAEENRATKAETDNAKLVSDNAKAITQEAANRTSADTQVLTDAKAYTTEEIGKLNTLVGKNTTAIETEVTNRTKAVTDVLTSANHYTDDEIGKITNIVNGKADSTSVTNELAKKANTADVDATYVTKAALETDKIKLNNSIDAKLSKDEASTTYATKVELGKIDGKVKETKDELTTQIGTKANSSEVYNKSAVDEKLSLCAKAADVDSKLGAKLNVTNAELTYATKEALQDVKDTYTTKVYVDGIDAQLDGRIKSNKTAIDNFALSYNEATSTLTFTDKTGKDYAYQLYSGSLVKSGSFDSVGNNIILTIENAGTESNITIPVESLLSNVEEKIEANANDIKAINSAIDKLAKSWTVNNTNTVTLTKTTVGENDTLSANVKISSSNKQAINIINDGLYVSNDLEDYTVVFGAEGTISGQTAISKLLENSNTLSTKVDNYVTANNKELAKIAEQVKTNTSDIAVLKSTTQDTASKVNNLTEKVTANTANITTNTTEIGKLKETVATHTTQIASILTNVGTNTSAISELKETVATIKETVKTHGDTLTRLDGQVSKNTASIETINRDLGTMKTDVATCKASVTTLETKVSGIEQQLTTLNTAVTSLNNIIKDLEDKIPTLVTVSTKEGNIVVMEDDGLYVSNIMDEGNF